MSAKLYCDGCGVQSDACQPRGIVKKLDYCPNCLPVVDAFLKARDAAHLRAAEKFQQKVGEAKIGTEGLQRLPDA